MSITKMLLICCDIEGCDAEIKRPYVEGPAEWPDQWIVLTDYSKRAGEGDRAICPRHNLRFKKPLPEWRLKRPESERP